MRSLPPPVVYFKDFQSAKGLEMVNQFTIICVIGRFHKEAQFLKNSTYCSSRCEKSLWSDSLKENIRIFSIKHYDLEF